MIWCRHAPYPMMRNVLRVTLVNLKVSYRSVRVGWCVRLGKVEDVRRVLGWAHAIWGDRYNLIIPVGAGVDAEKLVSRFRADTLFPAFDDSNLKAFADSFSHLGWPDFQRSPTSSR